MMTFEEILYSGGKKILCPFHIEKTPSFSINLEKQVYFCFGCQNGGSLIKLKSLLDNISYAQAKWDLYKGEVPDHIQDYIYLEKEDIIEDVLYPEYKLFSLSPAGEIKERGIKDSSKYDIRIDKENNLYFPIRDKKKILRGCQVRLIKGDTKFDQFLLFKRGLYLFGEDLLDHNIKQLIITEGVLDTVKLNEVLQIPSVAIMGSVISNFQINKLIDYPDLKEIIFWKDNDNTGNNNLIINYNKLKTTGVYISTVKYESDKKDPCDLTVEEITMMYSSRVWAPLT